VDKWYQWEWRSGRGAQAGGINSARKGREGGGQLCFCTEVREREIGPGHAKS
jgi:hypothetical protein